MVEAAAREKRRERERVEGERKSIGDFEVKLKDLPIMSSCEANNLTTQNEERVSASHIQGNK